MSSNSLKACLICKDEVAPIEKIPTSPGNSLGKNAAWLLDCIRGDLFHSQDEKNQMENSSEKKVSLFCMACMEHAQEWREFKDEAKRLLRKGQEIKSTVISLIIQSSLEIDGEAEDVSHLPENFRKICNEFTKLREEVAQEYEVDPDSDVQEQVLSKLKALSARLSALAYSNGLKNGTEVKRGRGRPRINRPKDLNVPKRPRGRPPKRPREESQEPVQVTPERVSKRARVSPKKFSTNFIFQKSEYAQSVKPKRGRGRPPKRKVSEQEDEDEERESQSSADENQDSKSLNKSATSDSDSPKEVATPVKKGRGRPKKNSVTPSLAKIKPEIEKDGSDFENDKTQVPKKRGRGRPKKNSLLETSQVSNDKKPLMTNGSPGAPAKRPRGRPKNPNSSGTLNGTVKKESPEDVLESSQSQEEDSQSDTEKPESGDDGEETELIIEVNADEETNGVDNEEEKEEVQC